MGTRCWLEPALSRCWVAWSLLARECLVLAAPGKRAAELRACSTSALLVARLSRPDQAFLISESKWGDLESAAATPQQIPLGAQRGLSPHTALAKSVMWGCLFPSALGRTGLAVAGSLLFALAELLGVEERVRRRPLDGVPLSVEWVQQTDSVLVQSRGAGLSRDLLELYFENKRSGGGSVQAVRVLAGGRAAVISFQDRAGRVLEKPHRLQESDLDLSPYYDFLEPPDCPPEEGAEAPPGEAVAVDGGPQAICVSLEDTAKRQLLECSGALPELQAAFPELTLRLEENGAWISGGDAARRQQLQEQLLDTLQGMAQELLPLPAQTLSFLKRGDVREEVERLLASQGLPACYAPSGSALSVTALSPVAARQAISSLSAALSPFCLAVSAQHLLVSMEPGMLRYLQLYYQELLAGIAEVTLLPLEGTDVTGFRLSGEAGACRAAAEFLQSLLGTISCQPVTLRHPGVARFLLEERGQSILRELESRFQCVIGLEQALSLSSPPPAPGLPRESGPACLTCCCPAEEIKGLLASLQPGDVAGAAQLAGPAAGEAPDSAATSPEEEEDLYTVGEPGTAPFQSQCSMEEEAQLLLAIQQSMDSQRWEEEELQRATELSLLQAALAESLEEALCVAGSAQLTIYSAYEQDVSALPGQLEQALRAQQCQEKVASEALRALPSRCRGYLAQLQRQHTVRISLQDATATVHGFADYTAHAARDLTRLLTRLLQAQLPLGEPAARWPAKSLQPARSPSEPWPIPSNVPAPAGATLMLRRTELIKPRLSWGREPVLTPAGDPLRNMRQTGVSPSPTSTTTPSLHSPALQRLSAVCPTALAGRLLQNLPPRMLRNLLISGRICSWPVSPHLLLCQRCPLASPALCPA
uniref:Uncharacterized protein n=1 Tax=Terrapene triunguis TaxID=2587831 RepID=A0A674J4Z2_9SAUR